MAKPSISCKANSSDPDLTLRMSTKRNYQLALLSLVFGSLFACLGVQNVEAARPDGLEEMDAAPSAQSERRKSGTTVLEVQKALSEMGFYLGELDGHLNPETVAAVRVYQQLIGQKIDGRITRQLWDLLNNAVQVRGLLKRLDTVRKSGKDKAREALLSHVATRDLVTVDKDERANPTRNVDACFAEPTVRCLLEESRESVKAVFKPELRDWALGEILVAQARAGLSERAMQTASRIRDPRLIVVALRDIAEALASSGNTNEALDAVKIIPDAEKRAEALSKIAEIHARQRDQIGVRTVANSLLEMIDSVQPESKQVPYKMRMVKVLERASSPIRSRRLFETTEQQARDYEDNAQRNFALGHIATTLAQLGRPEDARAIQAEITTKADIDPVTVAIAKAMADSNNPEQALQTAAQIKPRYRATVLSHIALTQAGSDALDITLELATNTIKEIKLPYARSFARSRLAQTLLNIGATQDQDIQRDPGQSAALFQRAAGLASEIEDNRLRAYTLWSVAYQQERGGDQVGSDETRGLALKTTDEIKSRLSRVWMYADLAAQNARRGDDALAWDAFNSGLEAGKAIDNPWGRARSLAKLAQTLIELIAPGRGLEDKTTDIQSDQ